MASYKDQELGQISNVLGMRERLKGVLLLDQRAEKDRFLECQWEEKRYRLAAGNKKSAVLGR
jgi:hypothetical protein